MKRDCDACRCASGPCPTCDPDGYARANEYLDLGPEFWDEVKRHAEIVGNLPIHPNNPE